MKQTRRTRKLPASRQSHITIFHPTKLQLPQTAIHFIFNPSLKTLIFLIPSSTATTTRHHLPRATPHVSFKTLKLLGSQRPSASTDIHLPSRLHPKLFRLYSPTSLPPTAPTTAFLRLQASLTSSKPCQAITLRIPTDLTHRLSPYRQTAHWTQSTMCPSCSTPLSLTQGLTLMLPSYITLMQLYRIMLMGRSPCAIYLHALTLASPLHPSASDTSNRTPRPRNVSVTSLRTTYVISSANFTLS